MQFRIPHALSWRILPLLAIAIAISVNVQSQDDEGDDDPRPAFLFGSGALTPPEGAANQDATGSVHLLQKGERNAVHIRVAHLDPGATYDVRAARGDTSESIGSITTHDGMPPPPRCFKAKLAVPAPPDDGGDGDGNDDPAGAGGFGRRHDGRGEPAEPRGYALFSLNSEGTHLRYWIVARGLGDVSAARLQIGDASIDLEADGSGSVEVTAEQLAALAAGNGSVSVVGSGEAPVTISGAVEVCFSEWRDRAAARKAGRGTLRIDTTREGNTLPLGAASVADLVGVTFSVVDAAGATVLAGSVAELMEGGRKPDGPGADEPCEADLARPDPAADDDAAGEVEIEGEELEVEVWKLAKSSTFDVVLVLSGEGGGSATLGQLETSRLGSANVEFVAEEGVALPFGKTKISELVGLGVEIKNAEGAVVLAGAIPAEACAAETSRGGRDDKGGGGGLAQGDLPDAEAGAYFQIDEVHDATFTRGDANDDGSVDLADAVSILFFLFQGGTSPYCSDASDANDNGAVEISDPIRILQYLYQGAETLATPYPHSGFDATPDALFCAPFSN